MASEASFGRRMEETLLPFESVIMRTQEVLFFKRPIVLAIVVFFVFSVFGFARSMDCGFFACCSLVLCVCLSVSALIRFFGDKIVSVFFRELPPNEDAKAYDRIRTVSEICNCSCTLKSGPGSTVCGLTLIGLAVVFRFVNTLYFNVFVALVALFGPGIAVQKPVGDIIANMMKKKNE